MYIKTAVAAQIDFSTKRTFSQNEAEDNFEEDMKLEKIQHTQLFPKNGRI